MSKLSVSVISGVLITILLAGRLWLAISAKHGDMYNNWDWGWGAVTYGTNGLYEQPKESWPHSRPNQPPGSIVLHGASFILNRQVDVTARFLNDRIPAFPSAFVWWWETHGSLISIKIFSIISDFITAYVLYLFGKRWGRPGWGKLVAWFYLLNPAIWYNSSFWGQTDSIVAALALTSFYLLISGRLIGACIVLGVSLITKASWAPIVPLWLVFYFRNYGSVKNTLKLLLIPLTALLFSIPFHPYPDLPLWLGNLYTQRILPGESAYISVNAFNVWGMVFAPDLIPDTVTLAGVPAGVIGYGVVGMVLIWSMYVLLRRPHATVLIYTSMCVIWAFFLWAPKMHERYLFPVFPLITAFMAITGRKWMLPVLLLSTLYLINLYHGWWAPGMAWAVNLYTPLLVGVVGIGYTLAFLWLIALQSIYAQKN